MFSYRLSYYERTRGNWRILNVIGLDDYWSSAFEHLKIDIWSWNVDSPIYIIGEKDIHIDIVVCTFKVKTISTSDIDHLFISVSRTRIGIPYM